MRDDHPVTSETDAHPQGKDYEISYTGVPVKDTRGAIVGSLEIITDLTAVTWREQPTAVLALASAGAEAARAARRIGFPVVVKADSAAVVHKSDMGAVAVNLADGAAVTTRVRDAAQGRLQVAWIESGAEGPELEVLDGAVRSTAGLVFFSVEDRDTEHGYQWVVVDHSPNRVRAWYPDPEAFVEAVERGEIPGKAFEGSVILGELTEAHLARIADPASGLLDWREPLVLFRVGSD